MNPIQFPTHPILLVDDEADFLLSADYALKLEGINNIVQCSDSSEVMSTLSKRDFSVVVLDLLMPGLSGLDILPLILADFPELPVAVFTAVNNVETAVDCLKTGAYDYVLKPIDSARLVATVRHGVELNELRCQCRLLKERVLSDALENPEAFSNIVTQDRAMYAVFQYTETIAQMPMPVLITGETGVGKELIAAAIHKLSGREGEFVRVNVSGLDDHLFSDALFGHKKGAYTGADSDRKGFIEHASNGTLFLDEIGDLHLESQVKLLRFLQDGTYYPLGDDFQRTNNARIVVATNREIQFLNDSDTFRTDLYFRLKPHHIHLPPLRDRSGDIPLLVAHFVKIAAEKLGKEMPATSPEVFTLLKTYNFQGNVRELEGMVLDAVSRHKEGVLDAHTFRQAINEQSTVSGEDMSLQASGFAHVLSAFPALPDLKETLKEAEQLFIGEALKRADGNQTLAAQLLGLSKNALHKRLSRAQTSSNDE